jgi:hypothetical protein
MLTIVGLRTVDTVAIPLESGFVLLGSSQREPISLSHLTFVRSGLERSHADALSAGWIGGGLYGFDRSSGWYFNSDSLQPWQGYWLPVLEEGVSFRMSSVVQHAMARVRADEVSGWRVRLVLISGGQIDSLICFGADMRATDGFDAPFDLPAPPPPPGGRSFSAWFEHPEWELPTGANFVSDVRSTRGAQTWKILLRSSTASSFAVTWRQEGLKDVSGLEILLSTDGSTRRLIDRDTLRFVLEGAATMTIIPTVSSTPLAEAVPRAFRLSSNFPNPFNASTRLTIDIPRAGWLTLRAFDVSGREVARVVDGPVAAGVLRVTWDPALPSGAYFIRATYLSPEGSMSLQTQRTLLLR